MTRVIYAHLQLWDPMGQMKLDEGLRYGGETMLFVLAAEDLASGLLKLLDSVAARRLGLIRLNYAGYAEDFAEDHFPFEVDMAAMVEDARETGRICAMGPYTFEPTAALKPEEVMLACVDLAQGAGGELRLAARRGSVAEGLRDLVEAAKTEARAIVALEDVKDASEHSEVFDFEDSVEDMVKRARASSGVVFSDAIGYERPLH